MRSSTTRDPRSTSPRRRSCRGSALSPSFTSICAGTADAAVELSAGQVAAWRLRAQCLQERAPADRLVDVVVALNGVHAQLMSAAELSLGVRVDGITVADVRDALWSQRTLYKTWAMRGTLHLLAARDFPVWRAALATRGTWRDPRWLEQRGLTADELQRVLDAVSAALSDTPRSRAELAHLVAAASGEPWRERLLTGWGTFLGPVAMRGALCFGPNRGTNVTFVHPQSWLRVPPAQLDPHDALQELLRRYLHSFGPATPAGFAHWFGAAPAVARELLAGLADEVSQVAVEGKRAWALTGDLAELSRTPEAEGIRLLPMFDVYTIMFEPRDALLDRQHRTQVYRKSAWISAVVLRAGRVMGVWELRRRPSRAEVQIEWLQQPTRADRRDLTGELSRLQCFLGTDVRLVT